MAAWPPSASTAALVQLQPQPDKLSHQELGGWAVGGGGCSGCGACRAQQLWPVAGAHHWRAMWWRQVRCWAGYVCLHVACIVAALACRDAAMLDCFNHLRQDLAGPMHKRCTRTNGASGTPLVSPPHGITRLPLSSRFSSPVAASATATTDLQAASPAACSCCCFSCGGRHPG